MKKEITHYENPAKFIGHNMMLVNNKRISFLKYSSSDSALNMAHRRSVVKPQRVVTDNKGTFLVVRPVDATRLERVGYTIIG